MVMTLFSTHEGALSFSCTLYTDELFYVSLTNPARFKDPLRNNPDKILPGQVQNNPDLISKLRLYNFIINIIYCSMHTQTTDYYYYRYWNPLD